MSPHNLTYDGQTLSVADWAKRHKLNPQLIRYRLNAGWPVADALQKPAGKRGRSAHSDAINAERQRSARARKAQGKRIQREFNKLVVDLNRALNVFNYRLGVIILADDDTPGVGRGQTKSAKDRCSRVAQECV